MAAVEPITIPKLAIEVNMTGPIHGSPGWNEYWENWLTAVHTSLKGHAEPNKPHRSEDGVQDDGEEFEFGLEDTLVAL